MVLELLFVIVQYIIWDRGYGGWQGAGPTNDQVVVLHDIVRPCSPSRWSVTTSKHGFGEPRLKRASCQPFNRCCDSKESGHTCRTAISNTAS